MSSLRKPKRITIRGDDEREHMFLIKGGEDLRMDQRVEQVRGLIANNRTASVIIRLLISSILALPL